MDMVYFCIACTESTVCVCTRCAMCIVCGVLMDCIFCRFATVAGLFPGTEYDIAIVANGEQGDSLPLTGKVTTKAASVLFV